MRLEWCFQHRSRYICRVLVVNIWELTITYSYVDEIDVPCVPREFEEGLGDSVYEVSSTAVIMHVKDHKIKI